MISSCPELMECISEVGFILLSESGIKGFSTEALVTDECRYVTCNNGGWG